MFVIFPAADVVDESYLALVAQEQSQPQTVDLAAAAQDHKRRAEEASALPDEEQDEEGEFGQQDQDVLQARYSPDPYEARCLLPVSIGEIMAAAAERDLAPTRNVMMDRVAEGGIAVRDLVHPSLSEPLKMQQAATFKLVKTGEQN